MSLSPSTSNFKPAFSAPLMAGVRPDNDMRRSVYICSISPIGHKKTFPGSLSYYVRKSDGEIRARKSTTYEIPAVEKGQWVVLQVFDTAQMITNTALITDDMGQRP